MTHELRSLNSSRTRCGRVNNTDHILREIKSQIYSERAKIIFTSNDGVTVGLTTELYKLLRPKTEYCKYNVSASEETIFGAKIEIVVGEGLRFWIMKDGCAFKYPEEAET